MCVCALNVNVFGELVTEDESAFEPICFEIQKEMFFIHECVSNLMSSIGHICPGMDDQ